MLPLSRLLDFRELSIIALYRCGKDPLQRGFRNNMGGRSDVPEFPGISPMGEPMPTTGIIAGSGFYEVEGIEVKELRKVTTPYGEPSDLYRRCDVAGKEIVFLSRHGTPHHIPPHMINYRANMWGFRELGVQRVLSVNAVGGINRTLRPGDMVIPDQVIDMTHGRASTFYDGDEVIHIDFTNPFCTEVREALMGTGAKLGAPPPGSGTYLCVNGPRLESKAEIQYFAAAGADIVGMTVMPEAALARELEICFAAIAVVTNYAAGISGERLTTTEVVETMKASKERLMSLLTGTINALPEVRKCSCRNALDSAKM
jgi:5'-methylthioadenosine phosphorylase